MLVGDFGGGEEWWLERECKKLGLTVEQDSLKKNLPEEIF